MFLVPATSFDEDEGRCIRNLVLGQSLSQLVLDNQFVRVAVKVLKCRENFREPRPRLFENWENTVERVQREDDIIC